MNALYDSFENKLAIFKNMRDGSDLVKIEFNLLKDKADT